MIFQTSATNARQTFDFKTPGNPSVRTFIFVPPKLSADTKLLVVMHGRSRNAEDYLNSWVEWATENNRVVICPQFDEQNWLISHQYNLGNVFTGEDGAGEMNPESRWSFTIVEKLREAIRQNFGLADERFDMFGHSAGAQFIHRFLMFKPDAPVRTAIAANAGWFTLPDAGVDFPYGWRHPKLNFTKEDLNRYTRKRLILLRGTDDTGRGESLRTTPEADWQGLTRFERAESMFDAVLKFDPKSRWKLIDVPNAAHEQQKMALAAQAILNVER